MLREYGDYVFSSKDNKIITITNKVTNESHTVPVMEAINFYNSLILKSGNTKDKTSRIMDFLRHMMLQYTRNIIKWCGEDFAPEWSNNYNITLDSDLEKVVLGYYFDEEYNQGDYIQFYLYPVNNIEAGYGLIFQIQYCNNILWELQLTTKCSTNFDKLSDKLPKRATFTLTDIDTMAPNVICNNMQDLVFKFIQTAKNELIE